jgi:ADP-ribose pyrophosphatase YjhB (NUDIX family)
METESVKCIVAVNAIITYKGKILLIKQNRPEKAKGKWGLP